MIVDMHCASLPQTAQVDPEHVAQGQAPNITVKWINTPEGRNTTALVELARKHLRR